MLSYIIPTHNRPERLHATLEAIAALGPHEAEVVIADNDSDHRPLLPAVLSSGVGVRVLRLDRNLGAAARNVAAEAAAGEWLVMLDDDSHPMDLGFMASLTEQGPDVGAVMADIFLAGGRTGAVRRREAGGLPEVFVGCGVAIRRAAFLAAGGYDASFGYYAEEYDLSASFLRDGLRNVFEPEFRVMHYKESRGRDMGLILGRLVRNNCWVMQRYSPRAERRERLRETIRRYHDIAQREDAMSGYGEGLSEMRRTIRRQPRSPLAGPLWERFTGVAHARRAMLEAYAEQPFQSAAIIEEGKNCWAVARALGELGVRLCTDGDDAEVLVIGTLSPGPLLDAWEHRGAVMHGQRVIAPWVGAMAGAGAA